jgi:ribosomal protein S18 acetylase RimI-like enzyme
VSQGGERAGGSLQGNCDGAVAASGGPGSQEFPQTPEPVKILPAEPADLPRILKIQKAAFLSEAIDLDDFGIEPMIQTARGVLEDFRTSAILKAAGPDGTVIGSVRVRREGGGACVFKLSVDPPSQGRGVGAALLRAAEAAVPAPCYRLFTSSRNRAALAVYERVGYSRVREEDKGGRLRLVHLEKAAAAAPSGNAGPMPAGRLILHDLDEARAARLLPPAGEGTALFPALPEAKACRGCFGCWTLTPGACVLRDRLQGFAGLIARRAELTVVSRLVWGGFSPPVKRALDRSISFILPFFAVRDGVMRHISRSRAPLRLTAVFYGAGSDAESMALAEKVLAANAANLGAASHAARFFAGDPEGPLP